MNRPRNTYTPGRFLPTELHAVGRPVMFFRPGEEIEAGHIAKVSITDNGELLYDVRVIGGATFRQVRLGDLNNPQPNTFTYAP